MDPAPFPRPVFDVATLHAVMAMTFLVQSIVIGFHAPLSRRFEGIKTFLIAAVVLALSSLVQVVQSWLPPGPVGMASIPLLLVGASLQYVAVSRFLGRRGHSWWLWGWTAVGSAYVAVLLLTRVPPWALALRELLAVPILFAAAIVIFRSNTKGFISGAILTALPFAGYALRSVYRFFVSVTDPSLPQPGPNVDRAFDSVTFFVLSFLWTSGFLLMVNQRLQAGLFELATRDSLTGCLNRRAMMAKLEDENLRFHRYGRPFTVIVIDLDRFKSINDTYGHHVGDHVLVHTASMLQRALRTGDSLARWGGEEFMILLPETKLEDGAALAERLRLQTAGLVFEEYERNITFSAGVATAGGTVDDVFRQADAALYRAKTTRNRVEVG